MFSFCVHEWHEQKFVNIYNDLQTYIPVIIICVDILCIIYDILYLENRIILQYLTDQDSRVEYVIFDIWSFFHVRKSIFCNILICHSGYAKMPQIGQKKNYFNKIWVFILHYVTKKHATKLLMMIELWNLWFILFEQENVWKSRECQILQKCRKWRFWMEIEIS
jgi:hypothetical protein